MPLFLSRQSCRRKDSGNSSRDDSVRRSFSNKNKKLRPVASFLLLPSLKRERSFDKNASRGISKSSGAGGNNKRCSSILSKRCETESIRTVQTEDITEGPSTLEIGHVEEQEMMDDDLLSSTELRLGGLQVLRRSASRPNPLRGILKVQTRHQSEEEEESSSSSSSGLSERSARRSVSFEELAQIHHHALALGDHPSANLDGPPLTLEWQSCCDEFVKLNLSLPGRRGKQQQQQEEEESARAATATTRRDGGGQQRVRRRPGAERKRILLDLGFKRRDLRKAQNAARKIQESREDIIYEEQERLELAFWQQLQS